MELKRFNVMIPVGSTALELERLTASRTKQMNETPLGVDFQIYQRNLDVLSKKAFEEIGACRILTENPEFNPSSSADCIDEFVTKQGWQPKVMTATGRISMSEDVIKSIAGDGNPIAVAVLKARKDASKLSQMKAWAKFAEAGQVQGTWDQNGTPMGRFTCDSPNLQNRVEEIRETILPMDKNQSFLSMDLGQAEFVVWASMSGDPVLTEMLSEGHDFHQEMGDRIKSAHPDSPAFLEKTAREVGKTVNLALLYMMTEFALSQELGIPQAEAKKLIEAWESHCAVAIAYREMVLDQLEDSGKMSTKEGRIRWFPEMDRQSHGERWQTKKTAWHHHNCGSSSEVVKRKACLVEKALAENGLSDSYRFALDMHDEVILVVDDEKIDLVKEVATKAFATRIDGYLTFKVDVRIGKTWLAVSK